MSSTNHRAAAAAGRRPRAHLIDEGSVRRRRTGFSPPENDDAHELGGGVGIGAEEESGQLDCARGAARAQDQRGLVAIAKALAARGFALRRTPTGISIAVRRAGRAR